ncbi:MAG: class I SAM-dependent methyltransferase [Pseudonocardia sp.]|nr:class I SAM-dependent methyltransferase [Pseudonocardia sp.]
MRTIDAESLTRNNLAYREPAFYDEFLTEDSLAGDIRDVAARENNPALSVLDLGCGTARLLGELFRHGITGAGIDVQPDLIDWARTEHPALRLEVADLRTVRLGSTFDLVVCVGNTLSYLHTEPELAAAFTTAAAHSHPGTLLAVATVIGAGRDCSTTSDIATSLGPATVDTVSEWNPAESLLSTRRTWRFSNGRAEHDSMCRRFWSIDEIDRCVRASGFDTTSTGTTELTFCAKWPR